MAGKSLLKRGFKAEAERIAENYRLELNLSKEAPLDAFVLANHLGIDVYSVDEVFEDHMPNSACNHLKDPEKFHAMWMPQIDGKKIIIHNDRVSPQRKQSNLMHEIAHIIRNHTVPDEKAVLCATYRLHYFNQEHEEEAKYLGACLQITRAGMLWAINRLSEEGISNHYNASADMVRYRLFSSGVAKQQHYRSAKLHRRF